MTSNLKKIRTEKNISQNELSKMTGISRTQLSRMENGQSITDDNIIKICKALNISSDYLLGLVDYNIYSKFTAEEIKDIKKTLQASADYLSSLIK